MATRNAPQPRVFPPPPPTVSLLEGVIDFHVHSGPDVFGRSLNDLEVARKAAEARMGALVLKNHVTETSGRAYLARLQVSEVKIFGGIVLNKAVGGINPDAVQWMVRMEGGLGKVVWLPTFDADHHVKYFQEASDGIRVVEGGKVLTQVEEVMRICADHDLILHTGHASAQEALILIQRARELNVRHIVVTHAQLAVVGMSVTQMKQAAQMGAYLEIAYIGDLMGETAHLEWMRQWRRVSIPEYAKVIKAVGAKHFILSTDLGQTGNPSHVDGYKALIAGLLKEGISEKEIDLMARKNPARLLGLKT